MKKERIDNLLVAKGLFPSRERARAEIMAGKILVNMQKIDKAGTMVNPESPIQIIGATMPYVSRGGLKLKKAIDIFQIDIQNKVVADVGASTGGFTDCALQHGARKVYAIDVGYGQLAWSLRTDERVVNLERTNIRHLQSAILQEKPELATIDVAFISLDKILHNVKELLADNGLIMALIKPQFEAGRECVGKKGVVREPSIHIAVISKVIELAQTLGMIILGVSYSPIKGPEGNIEYLLYLSKDKNLTQADYNIEQIVKQAHGSLD